MKTYRAPKFSTYQIRVLEAILDYMDRYHTTPSLAQLAEIVYGDPEKKTAVYYHITELRDMGAISDDPALKGRLAITDPEGVRDAIARDREIYVERLNINA